MISIIIPHANSTPLLYQLLNSIQNQVINESVEVIVVVNPEGRYVNFPEWKFSYPLIWERSKAGANRARQRGVQVSRGEVLLFLDDDCEILDRHFIKKHLQYHQDPNLSGVGGRYVLSRKKNIFGSVYNKLQNDWLQSHRLPAGLNMHLLGGNSSFKKEVFAEESYDENIVFGGTETELQIRLHRRKRRLKLFEDISIQHDGVLKFQDFLTKSFKQGIGAAYISSRHQRPPKFLFASQAEPKSTTTFRFCEWIYRVSFEAGRDFFLQTGEMKATKSTIFKKIIRTIPKKIFAKEFFLWREAKTLSQVISQELLVSKHSDDSGPSDKP